MSERLPRLIACLLVVRREGPSAAGRNAQMRLGERLQGCGLGESSPWSASLRETCETCLQRTRSAPLRTVIQGVTKSQSGPPGVIVLARVATCMPSTPHEFLQAFRETSILLRSPMLMSAVRPKRAFVGRAESVLSAA